MFDLQEVKPFKGFDFKSPIPIPDVPKPSPTVRLVSDSSSATSTVDTTTDEDPISIKADCIFCKKGFMDCEDNIEGVYCLNFTKHYLKAQGDRLVSKKIVIEKFEEGYNALKNAMNVFSDNATGEDPVFDRTLPMCIQLGCQQIAENLANCQQRRR